MLGVGLERLLGSGALEMSSDDMNLSIAHHAETRMRYFTKICVVHTRGFVSIQ